MSRKAKPALKDEEQEAQSANSPTLGFHLDQEFQGKRRHGRFLYKVPNIGDQTRIAALKTMYLPQGAAADANGGALVEMICYLHVTLQTKPDWWKPTEWYDVTLLTEVYTRCRDHEARFLGDTARPRSNDESDSESEDRSGEDSEDEGSLDGDLSGDRREVLGADASRSR